MVFQSIATPSAELEYVSDRDGRFKRPWERCKLLTRWAFEYFDQTRSGRERFASPAPPRYAPVDSSRDRATTRSLKCRPRWPRLRPLPHPLRFCVGTAASSLPWCTTPIEAESSLGPDSPHPIISLSGIPSAVMVLRILHPILASTLCAANPLARIAEPTIAL